MRYNANVIKQYEKSLINDPQTAHQQINEYYFPAFTIHTHTHTHSNHFPQFTDQNIKATTSNAPRSMDSKISWLHK